MRRIDVLTTAILILFLLPACGKKEEEVIKIGAVLPLTGNSAVWGQPTKEGIDLAVDLLNRNGGVNGRKVVVIYEDSKGEPTSGVNAVRKLIDVDKVSAIVDNSNSSVTLAIAPIVESNKVVLMITGASAPAIAEAGEYVFRIWNSDALEGELIAAYCVDSLSAKKALILYANNAYGKGLESVFSASFEKRGGTVSRKEVFEANALDFKPQIANLVKIETDVIYIVAYPNQGATLLRQLRELGNKSTAVGAVAFEDPEMLKRAGSAAEGLIYPLPAEVDTTNEAYALFAEEFQRKYGKPIPFLADVGYDGLNLIAKAMGAGVSGNQIRQNLMKIKAYEGTSGLIEFDEKGEVHKPFGIREVRNGKIVWRVGKLSL